MVQCTRCRARFMASPEVEARWSAMHQERFHAMTRATATSSRPRPSFDAAKRHPRPRRSIHQPGAAL